jgi:hypothetical protein
MPNKEIKAMVMSWARVFFAAGLATFTAVDRWDWNIALNTALCATIPVIIRALNPNDPVFGMKLGNE